MYDIYIRREKMQFSTILILFLFMMIWSKDSEDIWYKQNICYLLFFWVCVCIITACACIYKIRNIHYFTIRIIVIHTSHVNLLLCFILSSTSLKIILKFIKIWNMKMNFFISLEGYIELDKEYLMSKRKLIWYFYTKYIEHIS